MDYGATKAKDDVVSTSWKAKDESTPVVPKDRTTSWRRPAIGVVVVLASLTAGAVGFRVGAASRSAATDTELFSFLYDSFWRFGMGQSNAAVGESKAVAKLGQAGFDAKVAAATEEVGLCATHADPFGNLDNCAYGSDKLSWMPKWSGCSKTKALCEVDCGGAWCPQPQSALLPPEPPTSRCSGKALRSGCTTNECCEAFVEATPTPTPAAQAPFQCKMDGWEKALTCTMRCSNPEKPDKTQACCDACAGRRLRGTDV